jgi:tetratricopeptide (TPR) repeat protein
MRRNRFLFIFLILAGSVALLSFRAPQQSKAEALPADRLGSVNFPSSCSPEAQPVIVKGVALLHSFQYQQAEQTFADAAKQDPNCAMSYWGQALSLYHALWEFPSDEKLKKGREELEKATALKPPTAREREYIAAAASFFSAASSIPHRARVQAYSASMATLHAHFPQDAEAAEFYALTLVALASDDVDAAANRAEAIEILVPILRENRHNPGAAHYLIHATDTPELASQGLDAARAYAAIAPDSSHALHMPSHIFVRLGLWQEAINSNLAAAAAAAQATELHLSDAHYQTHAMDFLQYAYLQSGQESAARRVAEDVKNVHGLTTEQAADHQSRFACRDAMELHRWNEAAGLPVPDVRAQWKDTVYLARTIGAARSADIAGAKANFEKLSEAIAAREAEQKKDGYQIHEGESIDSREARAWLAFAEGKSDEAVKIMRAAAERQESEGVDSVSVPAREMLADLLLELKRPSDALAEYEVALKLSPNRFDGLYGAARAAQLAGRADDSQAYYAQLVKVSAPAADRPELQEARNLAVTGPGRPAQ